jgi:VIT1/CCC1 family predicted Fe2+/Mn2+ transporter
MTKPISSDYLRSAFFGIEDSLVSTTGLVAGIAAATQDRKFILLAGFVAVAVEAVSMGAGQYLSQEAVDELESRSGKAVGTGIVMVGAYAAAGAVPILPMVLLPYPQSLFASVVAALVALYIMGYVKGRIVHRPPRRSGFEVLIVGGIATLIGLMVGVALQV